MSNFNTNITVDDVKRQLELENQKKVFTNVTAFDPKNYLNTRLGTNETSKTLTIRLLPPSAQGGIPFTKVHMHTIKVNKEISESGWKTFVCPIHNGMGDDCPFCALADSAKTAMKETANEREKEKYKEIANLNRAKEMWVVRCVQRGHEEDGVKFWLIPNSKDGAYAKIMNVWQTRWNKGVERGVENNIFDLNNGKDLDVTITKSADGKNVVSVVDSDERTPLTTDYELGMKWLNDSKKWSDVYRVKPFEYMKIVCCGGVPVFSKEKNCYVDKNEELAEKEAEAESNLTEQKVDYSKMPQPQEYNFMGQPFNSNNEPQEDEDLPF